MDYDTVCKYVGRLYLESSGRLEDIRAQLEGALARQDELQTLLNKLTQSPPPVRTSEA